MGWKDGKKPEQYLFTITEDFSDNWTSLKKKAKKDKKNISDALRTAVSSKLEVDRAKKALILSPHTDDAELGCGGTIAKMIEEGWKVHVIYFSAVGERYPNLVEEAANSGKILGITHEVLNFQTRFFPRDRQEILQALYDHSRKIEYDLVFTPTTTDIHQDHNVCLLYTSPSPRDAHESRMPSSA